MPASKIVGAIPIWHQTSSILEIFPLYKPGHLIYTLHIETAIYILVFLLQEALGEH